jgi:hypothetical protein
VDGRTDQYAFAVALYEALVGERPFAGRGVVDRFKEGFEFTCPADSPLPKRLQRAITRALAAAPEQRFPSMDALLAALTADPWRGWRRAGASLAIVGVAAGLGFGLISRPEPCTGATAQIAEAWSADSRSAVTAALAQEGAAGAGVGLLTEFLDGLYARLGDDAPRGLLGACAGGELGGGAGPADALPPAGSRRLGGAGGGAARRRSR